MSSDDVTDPTARVKRSEVEVPVGPEEVWQAITTRSGTGGWMFPTEIEAREGGTAVIHREPFGEAAVAKVTAWDPPHRLAYEEPVTAPDGSAGPPLATEFLVEARGGGTCVVRVVSGFHHDGEGWEDLVEGAGEGWRMTLAVLASYLTHFAGRPAQCLDAVISASRPQADQADVSAALMAALGTTGLAAGDRFEAPDGAPPLAGVVDHVDPHFVLVRADAPCPALFAISAFPMGTTADVTVNVMGRLYGPDAAAIAERDLPGWRAWFAERMSTTTPPALT
jgi:uncharacterized protein YndB with AHSA1/START domain